METLLRVLDALLGIWLAIALLVTALVVGGLFVVWITVMP